MKAVDIGLLVLLALIVLLALRHMRRSRGSCSCGGGCGGNCSACTCACSRASGSKNAAPAAKDPPSNRKEHTDALS